MATNAYIDSKRDKQSLDLEIRATMLYYNNQA